MVIFLFGFDFSQPPLNLIEAYIAAAVGPDGGINGVGHHYHKNDDQYQRRDCEKMFQPSPLQSRIQFHGV